MIRTIKILYMLKGVWAIISALTIGSVLIVLAGSDPIEAYTALFRGAFFDYYGFATTLVKMSPLLLSALAFTIPLRSGIFNIGAEGQIYIGALFATLIALYIPVKPPTIHIMLCCLAGFLGGAVWALIPALLKAYFRISELIITLLMNYVAINLVSYFVSGPLMEEGAPYPYSREIPESLYFPLFMPGTDTHIGILAAIALTIVLHFMLERSTLGFSLVTMGRNPQACNYSGMSLRRLIIFSFVVGGGMAGLAGTFEVLGHKYRLYHMFSPGYGFDGIIVSFLGAAKPLFLIISSMFLAGLRSGANIMQRVAGVDTTVVEAIQGLVIIFVALSLAFRFDRNYWFRFWETRKKVNRELDGRANEKGADE
jgi:simple sugar transport system permease protein